FLSASLSDIPSPFLMKGIEDAVARLCRCVYEKEKVAVYGDYDVDGVTATSLMISFLRTLGCDVTYYIPDRFKEGYGINSQALQTLSQKPVDLVISVDCGTTAVDEVAQARTLGMDFIVTDHHSFQGQLPEAVAVLNPHQEGCRYPGKDLSGVGVAFNLALALRRTLREKGFFETAKEPNMADFLDFVSLGTVSDRVSLGEVNRIMVKEGLRRMEDSKRPGLRALKKISRIGRRIEVSDLGFRLGPRINAAGRLGSACDAVELLLADNEEDADSLAKFLDQCNSERRKIEEEMLRDAMRMVESESGHPESNSLVLSSRQWHKGVMGIVASSIARSYQKPAFLLSVDENGVGKGSGRSFGGINIFSVLSKCGDFLEEFGGHAYAAGVTVLEENIVLFREKFSEELEKSGQKPDIRLDIDSQISLASVSDTLVSEIETLSPFGEGNPEPLFLSKSVDLVDQKLLKEQHLMFSVRENDSVFRCIWFSSSRKHLPEKIDLVFTPRFDVRNRIREIQLFVKDVRDVLQ
ncbi:MAG: single-stranded-DNA-specific exonuclease RecJ, partial [Candidatus Dadabacteria bacterium]|nr:single-stranded-DNA-specific exonuclease RecJ [Candidatus Dadabacteria bacterium]